MSVKGYSVTIDDDALLARQGKPLLMGKAVYKKYTNICVGSTAGDVRVSVGTAAGERNLRGVFIAYED